jgi:predicted P-loop ATPase
VGSRGQVLSNLANVVLALSEDPAWRGVLAFDDFLEQTVLMRPVPAPGQPAGEALAEPRPISDADVTAAQHWLQVAGLPSIGKDTVRDAMAHVSMATRRHPVRSYLRSLTWDGEPRIDRWLVDYLGAPDTAYVRAVSRMWMIAAVARVMRPGAKVDHLLVLEGEQGVGKSSACRVLAQPYFGDDLPSLDDQIRAAQYLRGKWIIEVAEMHAFTKAESAKLKSFITQQVEQYIPKYGRSEVQEPRQCVFIATTNKTEYLRDETGGRRFWPVKVTGADVDALARDRDLLWAEAVAAYESGEAWWPSAETERELIQPEQEGRYESDAWEPMIADWLAEQVEKQTAAGYTPHVKVGDVATGALSFERARIGRNDQLRISAILERLGWERRRYQGGKVWMQRP